MAAFLLLSGYRRTQCLGAAANLGLFERLASDRRTAAELAADTAADPPSLRRLLRALVAMDVLAEDQDGCFQLTPTGAHFVADEIGPLARYFVSQPQWRAWSRLEESVRTGRRGFDLEHGMRDWDYYVAHPEVGRIFDAAMRSLTRPTGAAILAAQDFSRYQTLVDVGGGDGSLLVEVLTAHPALRGILFDRPDVVERAQARLAKAGVGDRARTVGGSFLDEVPSGADAYLMKWILHDWEDVDARRILDVTRRAMSPGSDLLVVERVIPQDVGPRDVEAVLSDLQMMVMNGGVERTEPEFSELLARSGFQLASITPTTTPVSVLRAIAV